MWKVSVKAKNESPSLHLSICAVQDETKRRSCEKAHPSFKLYFLSRSLSHECVCVYVSIPLHLPPVNDEL